MNIELSDKELMLINLFNDLREGLILVDRDKNIIYSNSSAQKFINNTKILNNIEHLFNFDLCALKEEDIIKYNPLSAAIITKENFKAECLCQMSQNQYKKLLIKSIKLKNSTAIFISNLSEEAENIQLKTELKELSYQISKLKKDNIEFSKLKERAESQAIRVGLINRISISIRDSLNINEIIKTAIDELSKTLGVYRGGFALFDSENDTFWIKQEWNLSKKETVKEIEMSPRKNISILEMLKSNASQISTFMDKDKNLSKKNHSLKPQIITPVIHQGKILGLMYFLHTNQTRQWHHEEVALVEGIAAQVAIAIYQASLFDKLENQKQDLEAALVKLQEMQTQLIQSEKMASLGQLVAGVAHEVNTPLGALNSNNELLINCLKKLSGGKENQTQSDKIFKTINEIITVDNEAIRRINNIVKSLKNFARLDEAEQKEIDIHEGIKNSLMLINHEIKNRITIIQDFAEIPPVKCYPNALNQVFMNILVNAYQSIQEKGTITIKTAKSVNSVSITFIDTGKGISKDHINKIFDPGFTTKGVGVGTGLGLSICYNIIEKHKGSIKVDSKAGIGTIFIIEIPIA